MFTLSFSSQETTAQEINSQLLITGHAWGWLQDAIAESLNSNMMFNSSFVSRGRNSQEMLAAECKVRELKFSNHVSSFIF